MAKMADVDWFLSCGRYHLSVNGFIVATEGDTCRDPDIPQSDFEIKHDRMGHRWNGEDFKKICGELTSDPATLEELASQYQDIQKVLDYHKERMSFLRREAERLRSAINAKTEKIEKTLDIGTEIA